MKILLQYLKSHIKSVFLFGIFILSYGVLLYLFDVPFVVTIYSTLICVFIALVISVIDFSRYRKRHQMLVHMEKEIMDAVDHLPRPRDQIEEDYQEIIRTSFHDKMDQVYLRDKQYHDMIEYYTLWAHQIKTPIAAMGLLLQRREDEQDNARTWTEEKKELQGELFKIEQYVEMVLCYLRLDGNSSDYVLRSYDLDSILRQAVRKYASQFIRHKCRLIYEPVHCNVLTDEKWLLFIIEQVISNGLKYTREGGQVEIFLESPKTLVIRDNGIGIAEEDLPRIFERGYTGYNGRADKKSTGIGLYLCRRIAENLGHKITAASEVGKGTAIRIDLEHYDLKTE